MKKKITSLILVLVILLSFSAVNIVSAKEASDEQLYIDLGILPEKKTAGLIKPSLNREQFAGILIRMQGLSGLTEVVDLASDIEKSKLKNEINYCLSYGYLKADEEGNFRPNENISYSDTISALVTVLGYDTLIEDKKNDASYAAIAGKIGLLKGVKIANTEKLSYDELYRLVTNAMKIKMPQHDILEESYTETLYDRLDVTEFSGKVLANSTYSAGVKKPAKNYVNIGGEVYAAAVEFPNELVGLSVTYYIKDNVIVSVSPSTKINRLILTPSDILSIKDRGSSIVLECTDDEEIEIKKSALAIVNNKVVSPTKALFDVFKSGTCVLIDSQNSGEYDVIHIDIAKTLTVNAVSFNSYSISAKYSGETVTLENARKNLEIYKGQKPIEFSEISAGDIISIVCDSYKISEGGITYDYAKAEYVKIYVSDTVVSGTVDQIDGDGYIYIDGLDYETNHSFDSLVEKGKMENMRVGDYVNATLDTWGYIADFEVDKEKSSYDYGYLIAQDLNDKRFDNVQKFKIMNSKGEIATYEASEKLIVDGVSFSDKASVYNVEDGLAVDLGKRQPIAFRLDGDGKVKNIDTAVFSKYETESSLMPALDFDPYSTNEKKKIIISSIVNREFAIGTDCTVFVDSAGLAMSDPEEHYFSVIPARRMANKQEKYIGVYDADEMGLSKLAVVYEGYDPEGPSEGASEVKESKAYDTYSYMVEKVVKAISSDGKDMYKITLANRSGKKTYSTVTVDMLQFYSISTIEDCWVHKNNGGLRTETETIPVYRGDEEKLETLLKPGDLVRFDESADGKISYIERIFTFEDYKDKTIRLTNNFDGGRSSAGGTHILFEKLEKTTKELFRYIDSPTGEKKIFSTLAWESVVVYDTEKKTAEVVKDLSKAPSLSTGDEVMVWYRDYDNGRTMEYFVYLY